MAKFENPFSEPSVEAGRPVRRLQSFMQIVLEVVRISEIPDNFKNTSYAIL